MIRELTEKEKAFRVMAVIYKLSNGQSLPVRKVDLLAEMKRSDIFQMSDADFEGYRQSIVNTAQSELN